MKHTTLYRKWRPRRFGEVVGQEPVVRTLRRAIETDRVAHAYLFSGPRGTGKTSTAKVLAMGLNCARGPTPEPCGECESCRAIVAGSSMDVVEMDAASNRGIDEIRDLRDRVNLAPAAGRTKVYIIDEVHMLTAEAFNALLKMLEEPPEHVIFVLATTEKHKVLPTIISRCQSFDFRRPGVETLSRKLAEIAESEGIEAEPEALYVIARAGGGSFRDAEGLLDQLASFSEGPISASLVREMLGSVGPEALLEVAAALYERRAADALRVVDRISNEGRDVGQFAGELISHLRNLMLLPYAPEVVLAEVGAEERGPLQEQANEIPTAEVVRMIEALGEAMGRIKRGGDAKLELELCFVRLARDYAEPSVEALLSRLEALERRAASGGPAPVATPDEAPEGSGEVRPRSGRDNETAAEGRAEDSPAGGEQSRDGRDLSTELAGQWGSVMQDLKRRRQALTAAVYGEARVEGFDGEVLKLLFSEEHGFHVGMARERRHVEELCKTLEERLGVRPRLEVRVDGEAGASAAPRAAPASPENQPEVQAPGTEEDGGPDAGRTHGRHTEGFGGAGARSGAAESPGRTGDSDIIRDQREVFRMARERFGPEQNGGS